MMVNEKAEMALIGAILLDADVAFKACCKYGISSDSFLVNNCKKIYAGIEAIQMKARPVDVLLVLRECESILTADEYRGLGEFADQCMLNCPTAAHAAYYADIVHKFQTAREFVQNNASASAEAESNVDNIDEVISCHRSKLELLGKEHSTEQLSKDIRADKMAMWEAAKGKGFVGVPSCINEINSYLGGWRAGRPSILAGYRSEGKSTLVRQECVWLARNGYKSALFALEDPADVVWASMACYIGGVPMFNFDTGIFTHNQFQRVNAAWDELDQLPVHVFSSGMKIQEIVAQSRYLRARHKIDIIYIDHVQLIRPLVLPGCSRNDTIGSYSATISALTKELDIPIVLVSQFSRAPEQANRRPRLSDLRDSGTLEQDAGQVILLYYDGDSGNHIANIAKNNNGKTGEVEVVRMDGLHRFESKEMR